MLISLLLATEEVNFNIKAHRHMFRTSSYSFSSSPSRTRQGMAFTLPRRPSWSNIGTHMKCCWLLQFQKPNFWRLLLAALSPVEMDCMQVAKEVKAKLIQRHTGRSRNGMPRVSSLPFPSVSGYAWVLHMCGDSSGGSFWNCQYLLDIHSNYQRHSTYLHNLK